MIYTTAYIQYAHISHRLSGDRIRLPVFRMRAQKQWAPSESRAGGRPAGRASRPADLRRRQERLGKGQMGSASLQIPCFFTEGLLGVFPLTYFYHPKSARAHLFPQLVKNHNFCSGPISVDPICPQPRNSQSNENVESTLRRAAERERERERVPQASEDNKTWSCGPQGKPTSERMGSYEFVLGKNYSLSEMFALPFVQLIVPTSSSFQEQQSALRSCPTN